MDGDLSSSLAAEELIDAAQAADEERCLELLNLGADIGFTDVEGRTPLHWAASLGLGKLCKELLKRGAAVDVLDLFGCSALYEAVIRGQPAMCRLLVEGGANLEQADEDASGLTPLLRAAVMVAGGSELLSHELQMPIGVSTIESILEACMVLLELGAQTTGITDIGSALSYIARMCKKNGDDVESSTKEVCRMLLDGGAPVNYLDAEGRTALYSAVDGDHVKVCRLLLQRGANVNHADAELMTPLLYAIGLGRKEITKLFLENGAEVNHVNGKGVSPLHVAASTNQEEVCRLLLSAGADTKLATKENGSLPIHSAASRGHTGICKLLLERGSALEVTNLEGLTPLFLAAAQGHTSTCKLLLERGAAVDRACAIDEHMCAPVVIAAYGKGRGSVCTESLELVNIFMDHGVDYRTIYEVAVKRKDRDLVETIALHTSFDPTSVPNGALLQDLVRDLAEWRSMPNNLQDALVNFAGSMDDLQKAAERDKELPECKDGDSRRESKKSKKSKKRKL